MARFLELLGWQRPAEPVAASRTRLVVAYAAGVVFLVVFVLILRHFGLG